jgi:hypothetical protein
MIRIAFRLYASMRLMLPGVTTGLKPLIELVAYFPRSARMEKADRLAGRDLESWGCRPMMLELRTVFFQSVA